MFPAFQHQLTASAERPDASRLLRAGWDKSDEGSQAKSLSISPIVVVHCFQKRQGPLLRGGSSRPAVRPLDGVAIWLPVPTARYGLAMVCEEEDANGWTGLKSYEGCPHWPLTSGLGLGSVTGPGSGARSDYSLVGEPGVA